jgi:hypothetical protein
MMHATAMTYKQNKNRRISDIRITNSPFPNGRVIAIIDVPKKKIN